MSNVTALNWQNLISLIYFLLLVAAEIVSEDKGRRL
jgi:hypothetical protein